MCGVNTQQIGDIKLSKKILIIFLCTIIVFSITGCLGIKHTTYKSSQSAEISERVKNSVLTEEEKDLFFQAVAREIAGEVTLDGKKINTIITEQRVFNVRESSSNEPRGRVGDAGRRN